MGCRILFVEDHADTCVAFSILLAGHGHSVTTAVTFAEAVEHATSQQFDLLVTDTGLPDGNGLDLLALIQERYPIMGITISGYALPDDVARSAAAGFIRHLLKPVQTLNLPEIIDELMACAR